MLLSLQASRNGARLLRFNGYAELRPWITTCETLRAWQMGWERQRLSATTNSSSMRRPHDPTTPYSDNVKEHRPRGRILKDAGVRGQFPLTWRYLRLGSCCNNCAGPLLGCARMLKLCKCKVTSPAPAPGERDGDGRVEVKTAVVRGRKDRRKS
jgi:hypothetical protein